MGHHLSEYYVIDTNWNTKSEPHPTTSNSQIITYIRNYSNKHNPSFLMKIDKLS